MLKPRFKKGILSTCQFLRRRLWQILILVIVLYLIIDYYDFDIATGFGFFSKQFKPNPIEAITAVLLLFTLYETRKTSKEALRQTEITLRPYMRLSWNIEQIGDNRRTQGITDSCIVVSNSGKGLMRLIKYNVEVNGKIIGIRNHSLIESKSSTNMVYDDLKNNQGAVLGCRNDINFEKQNSEIIQTSRICIAGSYRDVEGRKYSFSFVSDPSEQSWFREKYRQQLIIKQ